MRQFWPDSALKSWATALSRSHAHPWLLDQSHWHWVKLKTHKALTPHDRLQPDIWPQRRPVNKRLSCQTVVSDYSAFAAAWTAGHIAANSVSETTGVTSNLMPKPLIQGARWAQTLPMSLATAMAIPRPATGSQTRYFNSKPSNLSPGPPALMYSAKGGHTSQDPSTVGKLQTIR